MSTLRQTRPKFCQPIQAYFFHIIYPKAAELSGKLSNMATFFGGGKIFHRTSSYFWTVVSTNQVESGLLGEICLHRKDSLYFAVILPFNLYHVYLINLNKKANSC